MNQPPTNRLTLEQASLARRCLTECGAMDELIASDIPLSGNQTGMIAYAHRPFDARSAAIAVIPAADNSERSVAACRETGASRVFVAGKAGWEVWTQSADPDSAPIRERPYSLKTGDVEKYFVRERRHLEPHALFRAKAWNRAMPGSQSDFVDSGFLPAIEREAGKKLNGVFKAMMGALMEGCGWKKKAPKDNKDARWLIKSCFFLLSAKLFHERRNDHNGIPSFRTLDWTNVETIFSRVARHYSKTDPQPPPIQSKQRLAALQDAADIAKRGPHFPHLSAETLGEIYNDELLDPETRKRLNIYRTPTYLVDYMVAKLSPWIIETGAEASRIFEPSCGHAPFLTGALRLLSDILAPKYAGDAGKRHKLLRDSLHGCDTDRFALDIARLSLTLADIPRENGWVLEGGDMYANQQLENGVKAATAIFCNPPFRGEQAARLFQRAIAALQPGAAFGFVLPVNELTGAATADVRRQIQRECEVREISVFSDKMFDFASVETGIILGRRLPQRKTQVAVPVLFRRVRESKKEAFEKRWEVSWEERVSLASLATENGGSFVVPELQSLWKACEHLPRLGKIVAGQGLFHIGRDKLPEGVIAESNEPFPGGVQGFASVAGCGETHTQPSLTWLNLDDEVVDRTVAGTKQGLPQVVMNYAPVDRDAWRLKAFIDDVGRPATSRFAILRPTSAQVSVRIIWAICNSPFANAYAYAMATKRDITVGIMRQMRIPDLATQNLATLNRAVDCYITAAKKFSVLFSQQSKAIAKKGKRPGKEPANQLELGMSGVLSKADETAKRDHLRALHWRVDAEVLKLYSLPPKLERELLDFFDGVPRVGVPFTQEGYIPLNFRDLNTLDEYLRITDEWEATNTERQRLLDKDYDDTISPTEKADLKKLQRLLMLRRRRFAPMDFTQVDAALARLGVSDIAPDK